MDKFLAQNLIPNPGFESVETSKNKSHQVGFNQLKNWLTVNEGSPDLLRKESNMFGKRMPAEGKYFSGILLYDADNPEYREYLGVRLSSPLVADTTYYLRVSVSAAVKSYFLTDRLGILFHEDSIYIKSSGHLPHTPTIYTSENVSVADTVGWSNLEFTFKAKGGERYMVVGNFWPDQAVHLQVLSKKVPYRVAYTYFDGFLLRPYYSMNLEAKKGTSKIISSDSKTLDTKGKLFVPDVISPNGDGFNDEFFIPGLPQYSGLTIMNKKNKEIFKTKNYSNNWTGENCPDGKYDYEISLPDGNIIFGSFRIIRKK